MACQEGWEPLSELGQRVWNYICARQWVPVLDCDLDGRPSPAQPEAAQSRRSRHGGSRTSQARCGSRWPSGSTGEDQSNGSGPPASFFRMSSGGPSLEGDTSWAPRAASAVSGWPQTPSGASGWPQVPHAPFERPQRASTPSAPGEIAEDIIIASQLQLRSIRPRPRIPAFPEGTPISEIDKRAGEEFTKYSSSALQTDSNICPLAISTPASHQQNSEKTGQPDPTTSDGQLHLTRTPDQRRDKPLFCLLSPSLMGSPRGAGSCDDGPSSDICRSEEVLPEKVQEPEYAITHHAQTGRPASTECHLQEEIRSVVPSEAEATHPTDQSDTSGESSTVGCDVKGPASSVRAATEASFPGLSQGTTTSYYIAVPESQSAALIRRGMAACEGQAGGPAVEDGDQAILSQSTICGEVSRLVDRAVPSPEQVKVAERECTQAVGTEQESQSKNKSSTSLVYPREASEDEEAPVFRASKGRHQKSPVVRRHREQSDWRFSRLVAAVTRTTSSESTGSSETSRPGHHKKPESPKTPQQQQKPNQGSSSEQDDAHLMGPPLHPVFRKRRARKSLADPSGPVSSRANAKPVDTSVVDTVEHRVVSEPARGDGRMVADSKPTNTRHSPQLREITNSKRPAASTDPVGKKRFHAPLRAPTPGESLLTTISVEDADGVVAALTDTATVSVSLCVEHEDGGSQLRPAGEARPAPQQHHPVALVAAVSGGALSGRLLRLRPGSVTEQQLGAVAAALLSGPGRRLCFSARPILLWALRRCGLPAADGVSTWRLRDLSVAGWLLTPDRPPATFAALLTALDRPSARDPSLSRLHQLAADVRQLEEADSLLTSQLRDAGLLQLYERVEVPLAPLLASMEARGLRVEVSRLHQAAAACQRRARWLEAAAQRAAGTVFSLQSPLQLRRLLYEQLQLDAKAGVTVPLTDSGLKSTSETALQKLMQSHPLPRLLLQHRRVQKLKSTYVDGVLAQVQEGGVFPQWLQTAAATGRVQAAAPNLQSVPRRPVSLVGEDASAADADAEKVILARAPFVARPGHVLMAADFCQMELRLLAHLSKDARLTEAIRTAPGGDIFRQLAALWMDTPAAEVTLDQRERTKRVVYATMYGAGKHKLAQVLECGADQAQTVLDSFLERCPAISAFSRQVVARARRDGYVTSLLGRRRWLPGVNDRRLQVRGQAERQAVNFSVQGSAADVCKLAMLAVAAAAPEVPLLAQLHDELLWEVARPRQAWFCALVRQQVGRLEELLSEAGQPERLLVPLPVAVTSGDCWATMQPVPEEG